MLIGGLLLAAYAVAWPQVCPMIGIQGCPTTSLLDELMAKFGGGAAPPVAAEEAPPPAGEGGGEGGEMPPEGEGEYGEGEGGESYYVRAYPGYSRISAY